MRKPTNRTSYQEVTALYEKYGRADYQLQTVQDILNIHGYDITETTGYQDLTEENKRIFEAYVIRHLNNVGMNTRLTMWPKSVHYVRELTYTGPEEWDQEEQRNFRWEIGKEFIILKANGKTKKFRKYMDDGKTEKDIDRTTTKEFLRVDWKMHGRITLLKQKGAAIMAKKENQQTAQAERLKEILKGFGIRTPKDLDEALPKALDTLTIGIMTTAPIVDSA